MFEESTLKVQYSCL